LIVSGADQSGLASGASGVVLEMPSQKELGTSININPIPIRILPGLRTSLPFCTLVRAEKTTAASHVVYQIIQAIWLIC
jgi:hypothetical protein